MGSQLLRERFIDLNYRIIALWVGSGIAVYPVAAGYIDPVLAVLGLTAVHVLEEHYSFHHGMDPFDRDFQFSMFSKVIYVGLFTGLIAIWLKFGVFPFRDLIL